MTACTISPKFLSLYSYSVILCHQVALSGPTDHIKTNNPHFNANMVTGLGGEDRLTAATSYRKMTLFSLTKNSSWILISTILQC